MVVDVYVISRFPIPAIAMLIKERSIYADMVNLDIAENITETNIANLVVLIMLAVYHCPYNY